MIKFGETGALAALVLVGLTGPAAAQTDAIVLDAVTTSYILNSFLLLISGFLVMFMAVGFSMLEAGFVRSKNVSMQLTKNIGLIAVSAALFWLMGYNLLRPYGDWMVAGIIGNFGLVALEPAGLAGVAIEETSRSLASDFFFQLMFCAATASIVSGALAERLRFWPFMVFIVVLTGLIYPIQASWSWGGGILAESFGFKDFAGATVVHSVGGWAALAGAIVLGPRIGKYRDGFIHPIPASNLTLAALGTFLLWIGWFGFNAGSMAFMDTPSSIADISRIIVNTNLAAAGGALSALVLSQIRFRAVDLTMVLNGTLAGLVAITAEPLLPDLGTAFLIGAVGGAIVVIMVPLLDDFRIDDVVGAIPVHLCAGIWGTAAVVFTNPDASIGGQLAGIAIVGVFVFGVATILWLLMAMTVGIRVSEESELNGLDISELGMEAYPEFVPAE